jgi:NADH-quinone oxidoreductase subunit N
MYNGLIYILPEIVISSMACIILLVDLFINENKKILIYYLSQITLIISALCLFYLYTNNSDKHILFYGAFVFDYFSVLLKYSIILISLVIFLYSKIYLKYLNIFKGEYFVLCLLSILGMMIMISSGNFLSLYLGLELLSLPIYSLIIMNRSYISSEASMKYFIMGSIASGIFLFGISIIYGATGSIELKLINNIIIQSEAFSNIALRYGLVFIVSGLIFKFGAVPFHMWVPDVYEGSSIPVTLFVGTIPKIAALGMAYRIFSDTFSNIGLELDLLFIIVGTTSLFIGNIFALSQIDLKRLLGYSAIAHVGFVFLGFLGTDSIDFSSVIFYIIIYVLSSLGIFGSIIAFSSKFKESNFIINYRGIGLKYPILSIMMLIFLFSLAGVPPTAGFYAKFFILKSLISYGYIELAIFAVILSVIGAFYYLKIIKTMYFEDESNIIEINGMTNLGLLVLILNGLSILVIGVFPSIILKLCLF